MWNICKTNLEWFGEIGGSRYAEIRDDWKSGIEKVGEGGTVYNWNFGKEFFLKNKIRDFYFVKRLTD